MATEVIKYIKPAGQGGDYPDLFSWEAGEDGDLTYSDTIAIAEIAGDWSGESGENARIYVYGWTTDAARYIEIRADEDNRAGTEWDTSKYSIYDSSSAGEGVFDSTESHLRILVFKLSRPDPVVEFIRVGAVVGFFT